MGRRDGLRILWGNPWGFESPLPHQLSLGVCAHALAELHTAAIFAAPLFPALVVVSDPCAFGLAPDEGTALSQLAVGMEQALVAVLQHAAQMAPHLRAIMESA